MKFIPSHTIHVEQCSISLSTKKDEIIIENITGFVLSETTLSGIAENVLGWFCYGTLCHPHNVQDFKESMLTSMPPEGGIITIESVLEWIALSQESNTGLLTIVDTTDTSRCNHLAISV